MQNKQQKQPLGARSGEGPKMKVQKTFAGKTSAYKIILCGSTHKYILKALSYM